MLLNLATHRALRDAYEANREVCSASYVPLSVLRVSLGVTIDTVIDRIGEETGKCPSRGTISAIENCYRGASVQMPAAMDIAYGLPEGSITATYEPRAFKNVA